jgi:hypothetical protein
MLDAASAIAASGNALLDMANRASHATARSEILDVARGVVRVTSQLKDSLSDPQRAVPLFEEVLTFADRLSRLAGAPAGEDIRAALLDEVRRLGESATTFGTAMRQAADARGLKFSA